MVVYLLVGVLAGENLRLWLTWLPDSARWWALEAFARAHTDNPFAVLQYWLGPQRSADVALDRAVGLELLAVGAVGLVALRGAARLRGHFHDRHYRPLTEVTPDTSRRIASASSIFKVPAPPHPVRMPLAVVLPE